MVEYAWHGGDPATAFEALEWKRHRVCAVELVRVVRVRLDVDAHHLEARACVADRAAASTAEQVE
jgi:hypothetical protein